MEDDVLLIDGQGLRRELSWVLQHNVEFYAFHQTQPDPCVYQFGTYAMAISTTMMGQRHVSKQMLTRFAGFPLTWLSLEQGLGMSRRRISHNISDIVSTWEESDLHILDDFSIVHIFFGFLF